MLRPSTQASGKGGKGASNANTIDIVVGRMACKQKDIDKAPYLVHSHCTDLPKYRGGASISWMIMSKYNKAAITIFRMNKGI